MFRFVLVFLICIYPFAYSNAQSIRGRVIDNENNPIVGVNCVLMEQLDSTYITGTTTNLEGCFELKVNEDREYLLQLSFIGFEKISIVWYTNVK